MFTFGSDRDDPYQATIFYRRYCHSFFIAYIIPSKKGSIFICDSRLMAIDRLTCDLYSLFILVNFL